MAPLAVLCSRHIGIFLLLVFTSSLFGDSVLAAQNIYKYTKQSDSGALATSTCPQKVNPAFEDADNEGFQLINLPDDHEQEDAAMILSNCSSSLQILPVDSISLITSPSSLIRSSVHEIFFLSVICHFIFDPVPHPVHGNIPTGK